MDDYDVIVIGGGAAGLMCAITAGERGRRVVILEGSNKIGKKILMSGGGRCNFTNVHCTPSNFLSANPRFCISALSRYTPRDFVALVDEHGTAWHEKSLGQLFCNDSSKQILQLLVDECAAANVTIHTDCAIDEVTHNRRYAVSGRQGNYTSESLVVATGGLSIPRMGASDFGYRLARQFGLQVLDTRAGLVPFTLTGDLHDMSQRLAGVSVRSTATAASASFTEELLFTHRGLSGPAILQISNYWQPGDSVSVRLLPERDFDAMLANAKATQSKSVLRTILAEAMPRALVLELQALFWREFDDTPIGEISDERLRKIASHLADWTLKPAATEGYRTAEVTLGGIDTRELSSKTLECVRRPGLYFIGEVVDVTGHLGGFNFQWAWASGHAAGEVV